MSGRTPASLIEGFDGAAGDVVRLTQWTAATFDQRVRTPGNVESWTPAHPGGAAADDPRL